MGLRRIEFVLGSLVKRALFSPAGQSGSGGYDPPPPVPAAPTATGGTGSIALSGYTVTGGVSYNFRYSTDGGSTWTFLVGGITASTYTDTAAKTNIGVTGQIQYQAQSANASASSAWSTTSNVIGLNFLALSPVLWLKADGALFQDTAGTTPAVLDGASVARINDAGGLGNNFTQGTGIRQPILKLAIQNGQPVIRPDGVNDELVNASTSAFNALHNGTGVTVLWAGVKTALDATSAALDGNNTGTTANIGFLQFMQLGNLSTLIVKGSPGNAVINKTIAVAQGTPFGEVLRYKTGASPAAFRIGINNGADTTSAELNAPVATNASSTMGLFSSNGSATGTFGLGGDFYEWLILPSDLSDANKAICFTYLNVRWGLF